MDIYMQVVYWISEYIRRWKTRHRSPKGVDAFFCARFCTYVDG